jgi:two-component system, LytTR family, sensor kinase
MRSAVRRWLLIAAVWCVPAIITSTQSVVFARPEQPPVGLAGVFWEMASWQFFTLTTPIIVVLVRRVRLDASSRVVSVVIHLVANFFIGALHVLGLIGCGLISGAVVIRPGQFLTKWAGYFLYYAHVEIIAYWAVVAVVHAFDYQRQARQRAVAQAELAVQLAQAQVDALRLQLHPHFLFNTLNAITVLTRKGDTAIATRMLEGLSDLLRRALDNVGAQKVALREEIEFVDCYLEIEQIRFRDRLRVQRAIDPDILHAKVPNLILQPLVENALRHGLEPQVGGGCLELSASRHGDRLRLEIRDDGAGLDGARRQNPGIGLANIKERLRQLYGDAHAFRIESAKPGVRVILELPVEVT